MRTVLTSLIVAMSTLSVPGEASNRHVLEFSAHPLDTRRGYANLPTRFSVPEQSAPGLRLIQFHDRIEQTWLDALAARAVRPLRYVRDNGYLVWAADSDAVAALAELQARSTWLVFDAPMHPALKLDPLLDRRVASQPGTGPGGDEVDIVVQIVGHAGDSETRRFIESLAVMPVHQLGPLGQGRATSGWSELLGFRNLELRVRVADIAAIAERVDVNFIGERTPTVLHDEKQALILTGDLMPGPGARDHLAFLDQRGFPTDPEAYPLVDITDSTIQEGGTGAGVVNTQDPMLRTFGELDLPSRVLYFENCSSRPDAQVGAEDGHGTINASILAGFDLQPGWPHQDEDGHRLGLGINPYGRVGSTTIFVGTGPHFDPYGCGGDDAGIIAAHARNAAAISSNSWGSAATGTYSVRDQLYDAAVRNVESGLAGGRPMIYLFAASNEGPFAASIGTPGSAKNVITVGASENLRPVNIDSSCLNDSLASVSDDPHSVAPFSSRGPAAGNRVKPELIAPGTRITGSRSIYPGFAGGGVCISSFPNGQMTFSASSGTSHSTPAVAGVASLAWWWIENGGGAHAAGSLDQIGGAAPPSPALMKAWLIAHPSYLTGDSAGDDLPSNHQGYGMPDMDAMFDDTPKVLLDQQDILDASGENREYTWGVDDASKPVRIVLTWTDAPGLPGTSPQVNDLDLEVVANGVHYRGNQFQGQWSVPGGAADDRNNYEAVFLPPGVIGDVRITVRGTHIAGDGVPGVGDGTDQDFALVCSNCLGQPSFTMTVEQPELQVCRAGTWSTQVQLQPLVGFDVPVSLALTGVPAGVSSSLEPNPAPTPAAVELQLEASSELARGHWPLQLTGDSSLATRTAALSLTAYDQRPGSPSDRLPADGSTDVSPTPVFHWQASEQGHRYLVQVASDPDFLDIMRWHETTATSWAVPADAALATSGRYWWRVIARNACGDSDPVFGAEHIFRHGFEAESAPTGQSFTTVVLPGDCPVDHATIVLFEDDLESGASGWSHAAAGNHTTLWSLGQDAAHSGTWAWQAAAPPTGAGNDAWLLSPVIDVPADLDTPTLSFWHRQSLKSGGAGVCYDGAVVEVSDLGSGTWTALPAAITDPFDGSIHATFGNPLANRQAWCGDPRGYRKAVIDLQAQAGRSVRFRFRIGHDRFPHRPGVNWAIDDVRVAGCAPP